ncbi:MAG: hypothetical protein PF518_17500 [Spirochaetaceae bacterium]|nr:hypothetical protein [Spirochaetaceae bacterium]
MLRRSRYIYKLFLAFLFTGIMNIPGHDADLTAFDKSFQILFL